MRQIVLALFLTFGTEGDDVQKLSQEFGITLTHEFKKEPPRFPEGPLMRGDALPSDAGAAAPFFLSLLQSWPKSLVKKIGLETIVVSRGLRVGPYRSLAVAFPERHTLYVSVDLFKESHLHAVVLHNLFHFVDAADPQKKADDEAWSRINPESQRVSIPSKPFGTLRGGCGRPFGKREDGSMRSIIVPIVPKTAAAVESRRRVFSEKPKNGLGSV